MTDCESKKHIEMTQNSARMCQIPYCKPENFCLVARITIKESKNFSTLERATGNALVIGIMAANVVIGYSMVLTTFATSAAEEVHRPWRRCSCQPWKSSRPTLHQAAGGLTRGISPSPTDFTLQTLASVGYLINYGPHKTMIAIRWAARIAIHAAVATGQMATAIAVAASTVSNVLTAVAAEPE